MPNSGSVFFPVICLLLFLAFLGTACTQAASCPEHSNAETIPLDVGQVDVLWSRIVMDEEDAVDPGFLTTPVATDNRVYVATGSYVSSEAGKVLAYDLKTGAQLWEFQLINSYGFNDWASAVAIDDDVLYVVSRSGNIVALDAEHGTLIWQDDFGGRASVPVIANDVVYTKPSTGGTMLARDARTGKRLWRNSGDSSGFHGFDGPVVTEDAVYANSWLYLYSVDRTTGETRWTSHAGGHARRVLAEEGTVYVVDGPTWYALEAATGDVLWKSNIDDDVSRYEVGRGFLRKGTLWSSISPLKPLVAIESATGKHRKEVRGVCGSPFPGPKGVVLAVDGPNLAALNDDGGTLLWKINLEGPVAEAMWQGDTVYAFTASGRVVALTVDTGELRWQSHVDNALDIQGVLAPATGTIGDVMTFPSRFDPNLADYVGKASTVSGDVFLVTGGSVLFAFAPSE